MHSGYASNSSIRWAMEKGLIEFKASQAKLSEFV